MVLYVLNYDYFYIKMKRKFKYSKFNKHKSIKFQKLTYGIYAVQSLSYSYISIKQLDIIKQYFVKKFKKFKYINFKLNFNKIFTKKPLESRLGGGKGSFYMNKSYVKPGCIILESYNIPFNIFLSIIKIISYKLSLKLRIIKIK